jgi:glycosyltransferase involved in cell wall biosynthesis
MSAAPALSVVVPAYNQAGCVGACLRSVRAATAGVPTEVVVADDGSTDATRRAVADADPHALYDWAPNSGGPSAPRNRGFALSRGRYVAFLDPDDLWLPGVAPRAVELLDRHPGLAAVFADARMGNDAEGYVSWVARPGLDAPFRALPRREPEPGFAVLERRPLFRQLVAWNAVFLGACVVRREAFAATGGFDPSYWGGEDWEVLMRMAHAGEFGFLPEPLAVYTRHPGNVTNDRDKMVGGFCQALRNAMARCPLAPEDRAHVRRHLREKQFEYAYLAYDRGDIAAARRRFAAAVRAGDRRPLTLALAAGCLLPGGALRAARRLWSRG